MPKPLALNQIIEHFRESWLGLPDQRKANNNTPYSIADAGLAVLSTFFMQLPALHAYQRAMKQNKGRKNSQRLFPVDKIASDAQIRNVLEPLTPDHFVGDYLLSTPL
jgi:hypothetical protein